MITIYVLLFIYHHLCIISLFARFTKSIFHFKKEKEQ